MTAMLRPARLAVLALGMAVVLVPLAGLVTEADWGSLTTTLDDTAVTTALRTSVVVSVSATALCLLVGVPVGLALAEGGSGTRLARLVVLTPLVLPPVLAGTALLLTLGRNGLVGEALYDWFGLTLPFHTAGAVLATAYVALPFVVLSVEAGVRATDPRLMDVAATLGAGGSDRTLRVRLPLIAPHLALGATAAWARALGEFGATITFAGSVEGETRTLPLELVTSLQGGDREQAVAIGLLLLAVAVVVLWTTRLGWLTGLSPTRAKQAAH